MHSLLFASSIALAQPDPSPAIDRQRNIQSIRTDGPMTIDGKGTEPVWERATVSENFIERTPNLAADPPVKTSFQVCHDDENLYLLIKGELAHGQPKVRTLRRDSGQIFSDDTVSVKIDPLHDLRTVYAFAANTAGAQFDSLTLEDGRVNFRSWDGIWEVQANSDERSFTLEYKIPYYILGLKNPANTLLGLNVTRMDPNRAADYDWQLIPPSRSPVTASTAGTLSDVSGKTAASVLELIPYAAASTNFSKHFSIDPRKRPNLGAGLDLRMQTGPGAYVEGSVLTDFSQVDTDQVLIANDRFPLYYPERRPFFLNGADVFNFGHASNAQLFFSRRFALDGLASPVLGAVKAYGRNPKFTYGLMNIQTSSVWQEGQKVKTPENFSAARVRIQPIPQFAVGALALGRKRFASNSGDALSLGVDLDVKSTDNRFRSYSFFATTWEKVQAKADSQDPSASQVNTHHGSSVSNRTEFQALYIRPALTWIWSSENFSAPLGFYRRSNASIHEGEVNLVPRPDFWGLRDVEIRPRIRVTTTPDYKSRLTYEGRLDLALHWKNDWHVGYFFKGTEDRVLKDFDVFGDFQINAGDYKHRVHSFWLASPNRKILSGWLELDTGSRFGGPYHRSAAEINIRLGQHILAAVEYSHIWGKLPNANRHFQVPSANAKLVVSTNTRLSFDSLFRMDLTPGRKSISNQARMRWRYRPGSDLFVVYANQTRVGQLTDPTQPRSDHRLTLKVNWYHALPIGRR